MSQENYIISVYNPVTRQAEEIEVSEAVYNKFRRGGWRMENNDRSFRDHEIPFSDLKGGLDGACENFAEFRSEADDPADLAIDQLTKRQLRMTLELLGESDLSLLMDLFEYGKTEREIAAVQGVSQIAIHKRKQRLIKKLNKYLL